MEGSVVGNSRSRRVDVTERGNRRAINRKIWLPKLAYGALPWFYLAASIAAFLVALYIGDWFRVAPHSLLLSAACIHLALFVFIRRHRGRSDA